MKLKIKTLELDLSAPPGASVPSDLIEAVLAQIWLTAVKKAWTPLITALLAAGLPTDDLPALVAQWARGFVLGTRSKKQDALARKLAKAHVEERLREGRYSLSEAKDRGLIAQSVEDIFLKGDAGPFLDAAIETLAPADLLDPLPVTMAELTTLRTKAAEITKSE